VVAVLVDRHGLFDVPEHHDIRDVAPQPGNDPPWLGFRGAAPTSTNEEEPNQLREQPGKRARDRESPRTPADRPESAPMGCPVGLAFPPISAYDARMIWVG
jgi:hypothetical protein